MTVLTDADRQRIETAKAQHAATTPGPWEASSYLRKDGTPFDLGHYEVHVTNGEAVIANAIPTDCDFIAASHQDVPWLIGLVEALADYASDGNAMIALWSKMDADGWNMQVLDHSVRLFRGDVSSPWFDFPNPQAFPEAVARAALAAVGSERE